jgi:hypothetical protein
MSDDLGEGECGHCGFEAIAVYRDWRIRRMRAFLRDAGYGRRLTLLS